jgi:hypothetical protein
MSISDSSLKDFALDQSTQENDAQINTHDSLDQQFFQSAFELIRTLPIIFNNENIPETIYDFIIISVNFWNQIIPPPQDIERKYSPEIFSQGLNYCLNIISQHKHQQSIDTMNEQIESSENHQNEIHEEQIHISHESTQNSNPEQNSNEPNQEFQEFQNHNRDLYFPNQFHLSIISLISECYELIYPSTPNISNLSLIDKLFLIKTSVIKTSSPHQPQSSFRS